MFYKKLWFYLYAPFFLLILCALIAFNLYGNYAYREYSFKQVRLELKNHALLFQNTLSYLKKDELLIQQLCLSAGKKTGTRFTVISMSGKIIGDSMESPQSMDNHNNRPEIRALMSGKSSYVKIRYSKTLNKKMMYYSQTYFENKEALFFIRTSMPLNHIEEDINGILSKMFLGGALVFLISSLIIYYITYRIVSKVKELKKGVEEYSQGNFSKKIISPAVTEFKGLADSMNLMADNLDEKMRTIQEQRNRLEAMLSSMAEGLIAVDLKEVIISFNETFAKLINNENVENGLPLHEVVRNADLLKFVSMVLFNEGLQETQIQLLSGTVKNFIVKGTQLKDAMGEKMGAVIVLTDITKLKQLEKVRQDFVANVSHEIKTPITSIKGFVETLQDGALEDKEVSSHFVKIINRQVDRLITIIEDLLTLSQLDRDEGVLEDCCFHEVDELYKVIEATCSEKAKLKNIKLIFNYDSNLKVNFNFNLMEQALRNLVENALRYSENGKKIEVDCQQTNDDVVFSVKDEGIGIPNEHLTRVFERFYRVDKARSRKMGSTGLGLSIVNHIAQAHGGYPEVESQLGVGSIFKIHISK